MLRYTIFFKSGRELELILDNAPNTWTQVIRTVDGKYYNICESEIKYVMGEELTECPYCGEMMFPEIMEVSGDDLILDTYTRCPVCKKRLDG